MADPQNSDDLNSAGKGAGWGEVVRKAKTSLIIK